MNGLSRPDSGSGGALEEVSESEQLANLLRNTSADSKVIFGAQRGTFDLDQRQIENFFHLVDQRIAEQNHPKAKYAEFCVYYNDGTSRKFPNVEAFQSYAETRKRVPTVLTIHLSYFITFPSGDAPEKQEIDIVIRASSAVAETVEMVANDSRMRLSGDKIQMMVGSDDSQFGVISYTINHSRTSWGLDLEGHIKSHIETVMQPPTKGDIFLKRVAGPLNLLTTVFVGLYCVNLLIDSFFSFLYKTDGATTAADKLDIAADYLVNGQIAKYIVASIVVSVIFFVLFSGLISALTKSLKRPRPSFIVLDDADGNYRDEKTNQFRKRWNRFYITIGLDVFVAVLLVFLEERLSALWAII